MSGRLPYECEMVREQLPDYAEGTLIGRELARVERHVSVCQRCQAEVVDLRLIIGSMRTMPADKAPDTLAPRIRRAVQERERIGAPGKRALWPRLAIPMALLTGLIVVGFAVRAPRQKAMAGGGLLSPNGEPGMPLRRAQGRALRDAPRGESAVYGREAQPPALPEQLRGAEADSQAPRAQPHNSEPKPSRNELAQAAPSEGSGVAGKCQGGVCTEADRPSAAPRPGRPGEVPALAPPDSLRAAAGQREEEAKDRVGIALGAAAKSEVAASAAPIFARARLVKGAGRDLIALEVASQAPTDTLALRFAGGPVQVYEWRSAGTRPATIPVPLDKIGPSPAAVTVGIISSAGKRDYVLFLPVMSRLGQTALTAPVSSYDGTPLQSVLADLSRLTGLVILAEAPLDTPVRGALPTGTPEAVLRALAAAHGFEVEGQDDVVFTLTHRR